MMNEKKLFSVGTIAAKYGKTARQINKILEDNGVQFKVGPIWVLSSEYRDKGYTDTKVEYKHGSRFVCTYWTQSGADLIDRIMARFLETNTVSSSMKSIKQL